MTPRTFLINGLIAGLLAGILAFVVAYTIGEPPIDDAIALEEAAAALEEGDHDHEDGHSHDDEDSVSRAQQAGPGLATATILFGLVLGGATGIAAAFAAGRLGRLGPIATTALVAGLGFAAYALIPWIKYPPNPPAVGDGDTIGERTALYFGFLAISVLAIIAAVLIARRVLAASSPWVAVVAGAAVYLAIVGIAGFVFAPIDEVPNEFPANTLYEFRLAALFTQVALWATIGVVLSGLIGRAHSREVAEAERRAAAAAL